MRLGRALGYGTRHAAKTLAAVAEAAATPDPRAVANASPRAKPQRDAAQQPEAVEPSSAPRTTSRVPSAAQVRGAGRTLWGPLATFSGALWLRVTGLFFAVIALAMGNGAWRLRGVVHHNVASAADVKHFWIFIGFAVLFGYFAVSSFLRANLRERRAARKSF